MIIGMYDGDFVYLKRKVPNLELMKISAYHKHRNRIVVLSRGLYPERFTALVYRKDFDTGGFPSSLFRYDNIKYGGFAFSGGAYLPLGDDIEKTKPDTSIYTDYAIPFGSLVRKRDTVQGGILRAAHLRLSLDGRTVNPQFMKAVDLDAAKDSNLMFLHDYNLNDIEYSQKAIRYLLERVDVRNGGLLSSKFPVRVDSEENFLKWLDFNLRGTSFPMQYNGLISDEIFNSLITEYPVKNIEQLIYVPTTGCFDENDLIINRLSQIFRQVLFSRMHRRKILLKCDGDFQYHREWVLFFNLLTRFSGDLLTPTTLIERINKDNDPDYANLLKKIEEHNNDIYKAFFRDIFVTYSPSERKFV